MKLLDRVLKEFPGASKRSAKGWIAAGRVTVNGQPALKPEKPVSDAARLGIKPRAAGRPPGVTRGLEILYEDATLIAVNKPPGILSVPTPLIKGGTLLGKIEKYLACKHQRAYTVHRLDRKTSGVLVFAKSLPAHARLKAQFEARTAVRKYFALVHGRVGKDEAELRHLLQEGTDLKVRIVQPDQAARARREAGGRTHSHSGKPVVSPAREAITRYRVLKRGKTTSLLALSLKTGRRAQIRVQLASIGHPVIGDHAYGRETEPKARMYLHAAALRLVHPVSGAAVDLEAPLPKGFEVD